MKLRRIIFTLLTGCMAFGFISCSKMSSGIVPVPTTSMFLKGADGPPLYLVDNVEVSAPKQTMLKFTGRDIRSVNVLGPGSSIDLVSLYGPKAKNGVILVTTNKFVK